MLAVAWQPSPVCPGKIENAAFASSMRTTMLSSNLGRRTRLRIIRFSYSVGAKWNNSLGTFEPIGCPGRVPRWGATCRFWTAAIGGQASCNYVDSPNLRTFEFWEHAVPKGQQKSNRESRKPKAAKPKPGPRAPTFANATLGSTMRSGAKKK
jgi:hypothetical protein